MKIASTLYKTPNYHVGFGDNRQTIQIEDLRSGEFRILHKAEAEKFASEWATVASKGRGDKALTETLVDALCKKYWL